MNIKLFGLLSFLLFPLIGNAFNDDYASVDSSVAISIDDFKINHIANFPYTYCKMDNIPDEYCGKVSLLVGDSTFKTFYYNSTLANNTNVGKYFLRSDITQLLAGYYLPTYKFNELKIPTEGQLTFMFDNGLATMPIGDFYFWVRDSTTGASKVVRLGNAPDPSVYYGKLYRYVTDDIPSSCEDGKCHYFLNMSPWTIKFYSSQPFRWGWGVRYVDTQGVTQEVNGDWQGQVNIPQGATQVNAFMWKFGVASANLYDLETTRGDKSVLCLSVGGAPAVSVISEISCP